MTPDIAESVLNKFYAPLTPGHHYEVTDVGLVVCQPCGNYAEPTAEYVGTLSLDGDMGKFTREASDMMSRHAPVPVS